MAHQNLSIPHAVFAVTPTLFEELHNWQFQSGVTGRSSLPPCRQNMPALRRQAAMPRPARGGVNLVPGSQQARGFTAFFWGVFSLAQLSKHRPVVPLACCRHSFASGTWSCGRLQPSIPASCGSTPAKANLQSLLLEKLSLENFDWLSSFWNFYQRPVASTDCFLTASNKHPARHIAILPSYGVQPSTLNLSSAMNVVTFTSNYHANARVFPGAEQGSGFPFLS